MKKINFFKSLTRYTIAFLAIAFVFLVLGVGTVGSVQSVGKSYELSAKQSGDEKEPCIVLHLSAPEGYSTSNITVKDVYINVGAVYTENGEAATLRIARGTSASSSFTNYADLTYYGMYQTVEEKITVTVPGEVDEETGEVGEPTETEETVVKNVASDYIGNWVSLFNGGSNWSESGYTLSTYPYYKITSVQKSTGDKPCNILISEIVFVGEDRTLAEEERVPIVIPAAVHESSILYGEDSVTGDDAIEAASAIIDSQHVPSLAQSSFFRYGAEEVYTLSSILEMQQGNTFYSADVYHGDKVYNALGTDILALGTAIFGTSPFGLRIFPMLASFGILVLGYLFIRKLLKSEKAGLVFAILYALSNVFLSLGHFGTPLTVGLFFFVASFYCCYLFFANGMKKANFISALPLLLSGLFGAMAICVNGAYLIPVLGVVGLFVAGMIRQQKVRRYYLESSLAAVEEEGQTVPVASAVTEEAEEEQSPAQARLAGVYNEYRYKNSVAPAIFLAFLILGFVFVAMISLIPVYYLYGKLYGQGISIFKMLLCGFTGGYTGVNDLAVQQSSWSFLYELFRGTGDVHAVTVAGLLPAIIAVAAGLFGLIIAVMRLVLLLRSESTASVRSELRSILILLGGVVLSLITAAFAKGGLAFMLLCYFFAFGLAAYGEKTLTTTLKETEGSKKMQKLWLAIQIVWLVFLAVYFAFFASFTFSIQATFAVKLFG